MEIDSKVEEYMKLAQMDDRHRQTLTLAKSQVTVSAIQELMGANLLPQAVKAVEELQDKAAGVLADALAWDKLKPAYVELFAQAYSESELDDMIAFYRSPTGRSMVAKNPLLMMKTSEIMQQRMAEAQPELQKLMQRYLSEQTRK